MPTNDHLRTPMALGADLAQAVASYLLADRGFLAELAQANPIFTRARVIDVIRTRRGENRVKVHRTGIQRPDMASYPVWGSMMVPQVGDDVLLARAGNQTYVLGSRAGGNPHHLLIPFPGGAIQLVTPAGRTIAHHDTQHRHVHFGPTTQAGLPSVPDLLEFGADLGEPLLTAGTALRDLFVAHVHGGDGHALHGGDVFFGLDLVHWDGTGTPQEDARETTRLPHDNAAYGRHRISYGSPPRVEVAFSPPGDFPERLISSHDPFGVATGTGATGAHRYYHDTGSGHDTIHHEFDRYGLSLPHGHRLADSGTDIAHGSPAHPPKWHLVADPGANLPAGKWALAYTFMLDTKQSAASPRWIGTIGAAIAPGFALALPAFTVPSWVTAVRFYLSDAANHLSNLLLISEVAPTGNVIPDQLFLGPGIGPAVAPSVSDVDLVVASRIELFHGDPAMVISGSGTDTRIGVNPSFGTGYFKFEDNCITFPNGEVLCDGAGGGGGAVALEFLIDGGGEVITTGVQGRLVVPSSCTLSKVELLADQTGSIVVDIWKSTYAGYPPSSSAKITASTPPTISSGLKAQDSTLTSWTTSFSTGDILVFNVNSVSVLKQCTVVLTVGSGGSSSGPTYSPYENAVLADTPLAYWPLDELSGPIAYDISGNGHNATYTGDGSVTAGAATIAGTPAAQFNDTSASAPATTAAGQGTGITIDDPTFLPTRPLSGTAEYWINAMLPASFTDSSGVDHLTYGRWNAWMMPLWWGTIDSSEPYVAVEIALAYPDHPGYGYTAGSSGLHYPDVYEYNGGVAEPALGPHNYRFPDTYTAPGWHHIALTWDNASSTAAVYLDGAPWTTSGAHFIAFAAQSGSVSYGGIGVGPPGPAGWWECVTGAMAHVAYYDHALTGPQVAAHYAASMT